MTNTSANAEIENPPAESLDVSVKTRFYLVIAAVLAVLLGMFFIGKTGIDTLSAIRSYVAGVGLWSEAQTEAAYQLERYADTGSEVIFDGYRRNLAIPLSLKVARQELESPDPDMEVLRRGFTDAGIPLADVDGMVWLFRRFHSIEPIQALTDTWARGDAKIAEMEALGRSIHNRFEGGDPSPEEVRSLKAEIDATHRELDALAAEFSATLGEAARWAKGMLVLVLVSFTFFGIVVAGVGLVLVTRTGTRLERLNLDLASRNRHREGLNVLHEHLQGSQRLETMLNGVLVHIAEFVDAQVGAAYVSEGRDVLRLRASYGIGQPDGLPAEIEAGQGVIGQAARDRTSRLLDEVPADHLKIGTALTDGRPFQVLVLPLVFGEETKAVVEFGALHPFKPADLEFLEAAASDIALAVQTLRARDQVDALLAETQQQAEELEAQQEELRQTNEELEAQAAALEESQTELEELNAALEEKTEAVEAQRAKVEEKNADLEAARQRLVEKAKELETTSRYKSEFLANMSHELRTPLNSIILLSNLLSDNSDGTLTEKQVEFAETIHSSGTDLLDLINEVLDLAKVEAGQMELAIEEVELKRFLSVLGRGFEQTAKNKGLSFSVEVGDDVPSRIQTDERRLGQILKNLLSNAIKFTPEGRVELRVARPDLSDATYRGQSLRDGPSVAFSVIDTGIGIPEEQLPLVFQAFHQAEGSTDRKYGGTGLGLSITKELVDLLGGEVFVESEVGEGSRFTVVVPARLNGASAEPAVANDDVQSPVKLETVPEPGEADSGELDGAPSGREDSLPEPYIEDDRREIGPDDRSILIVEDDQTFAEILLDLARERGFKGMVAEEGRTALQLADHYRPSAVLLDIRLPDIDGMSIMERLKDNLSTRHIPIHVISAAERKPEALRKGAVGFLRKPTNVTQLKEAFERIERMLSRPVRRLLIAVSDDVLRNDIQRLIAAEDVEITAVASSEAALSQLSASSFDCLLVVADLPDMDALELLKRVRSDLESPELPAVAIVDEAYPAADKAALEPYADSIVTKDSHYPERVLDETALFLHRVEKDLPEDRRQMLRSLHDQEAILRDRTVLIVDDDMRNIFALSSILEGRDMRTMVAKNGREALDQLEEHADEIDLVLMDIMMPEMDGYEAMRRIRANRDFQKLPVIALTAKAMRGDRAKCIEAGASDYLAKPVDTDRLLSMLRVWLYR